MQTIGERFEDARKKKGISIREAAEATKIRSDYLQKFESNQFDIGLTEIYTRGFLRSYATFLKLPVDRIINDYTALGRGDARPRTVSREIYGRLEVSNAAVEEPAPDAVSPDTPAPASPPARPTPPRPRTGSSLPTGPDPALFYKGTKWLIIGVVALGAIWILKVLFWPSRPAGTPKPAAPLVTTPRAPMLGLVSSNPVQVTIRKKNADDTEGEVVFSGMLSSGETKNVPRTGALFIEASAAENLQIEINGRRHSLGQLLGNGYQRGQLPAP